LPLIEKQQAHDAVPECAATVIFWEIHLQPCCYLPIGGPRARPSAGRGPRMLSHWPPIGCGPADRMWPSAHHRCLQRPRNGVACWRKGRPRGRF
jgi:hypothetical protein